MIDERLKEVPESQLEYSKQSDVLYSQPTDMTES